MGEGATRWLTYDDMATALGITPESAKRLAMRRKWPRRPGNDGRALVAVPEDRITSATSRDDAGDGADDDALGTIRDVTRDDTEDSTEEDRGDARALLGYLERRVEELSEELVEARTEARGARFEAEALRVQAGRVDVLTALVEAERAHRIDAIGERDRLALMMAEQRRPWIVRLVEQLRRQA